MRIPGKDLGPFGGSNGKMAPNDGALFRLLTEWGRDATWVMDLSLKPVYMSPAIREQLGYSPEEYLSLSSEERLPPESLAIVKRVHADLMERAKDPRNRTEELSSCFEILQRHKDGSLVWVEVNLALIFDEDGEACGIHGVTRNIEERKRSERALRESEAKYRRLVELLPIGVFECDLEGRISYVNEALLRMLGYPFDQEYSKMDMARSLIADDWSRIQAAMSAVLAGRESRANRYTAIKRDGSRFPIEVHGAIIERDGLPKGFCGVIIDASDKKRAEDERLKTNKLEAVSLLAGGIAHDFNNILTAIVGYASLLEGEPDLAPSVLEDLEGIRKAAGKASSLTRQLLAFSRQQAVSPRTLDTNGIVRDMEKMLRRLLSEDIAFNLDLDASTPAIFTDPSQIEQVLVNLVVNAKDAMPEGGRLQLLTRLEKMHEPAVVGMDTLPAGEYAVITVRDTSTGIRPEILGRIFEPFFTTKAKDKGTGLGLSMVYGIAKQNGGAVEVSSELGSGTTFSVWIPASGSVAGEDAREERGRPSASVRPSTILFVDDNQEVRELAERLLGRLGHRVLTAANAGEAILIAESQGRPIDLLVSDIVMPLMDGYSLARRLVALRPGMRILYISGYQERGADEEARGRFLAKPFSEAELAEAVDRLLLSDQSGLAAVLPSTSA
jgi:PAS domain S-box-containing protein